MPVSCSIVGWNILPFQIYIYIHIFTQIWIYIFIFVYTQDTQDIYTEYTGTYYIYICIFIYTYRCVCVLFLRFDFPWLGYGCVLAERASGGGRTSWSSIDVFGGCCAGMTEMIRKKRKKHVLPICFFLGVFAMRCSLESLSSSAPTGGRGTKVDVFLRFFHGGFLLVPGDSKCPFHP